MMTKKFALYNNLALFGPIHSCRLSKQTICTSNTLYFCRHYVNSSMYYVFEFVFSKAEIGKIRKFIFDDFTISVKFSDRNSF